MNLPIDLVPNTRPQRFKWRQVVNSPIGVRTVDCEGQLPPGMDEAVSMLIDITKQLRTENNELRRSRAVVTDVKKSKEV